jgi:hypothetical protein
MKSVSSPPRSPLHKPPEHIPSSLISSAPPRPTTLSLPTPPPGDRGRKSTRLRKTFLVKSWQNTHPRRPQEDREFQTKGQVKKELIAHLRSKIPWLSNRPKKMSFFPPLTLRALHPPTSVNRNTPDLTHATCAAQLNRIRDPSKPPQCAQHFPSSVRAPPVHL